MRSWRQRTARTERRPREGDGRLSGRGPRRGRLSLGRLVGVVPVPRGACWWAWYPKPMSVSHCLVNGADRGAWLQSKDASDRSIEAQGDGAANGVLGFLNRLGGAAGDPRQQRLGSYHRSECLGWNLRQKTMG